MGMGGVVPTIPAFNAEAAMVDGTFPAFGIHHLVLFRMKRDSTPDTTVGTNTVYGFQFGLGDNGKGDLLVRESAGWTGADTFTT